MNIKHIQASVFLALIPSNALRENTLQNTLQHTFRLVPASSDWLLTFGTVAPGPGQAAEAGGSVLAGLGQAVVNQQLAAFPFIT